jgi:hypothetical protein
MSDYWGNLRLQEFSFTSEHQLAGIKILILVGSLDISGGTNLILNYAEGLKVSGAEVTIGFTVGERANVNWHPHAANFEVCHLSEINSRYFDLGIATWWPTVSQILKIECSRYIYFVQSLESRFALNYLDRSEAVSAAATYMLGLPVITVASWLQNLLMSQTPSKVWLVHNGIDKELFPISNQTSSSGSRKLRVLVEGALDIPMKGVSKTLSKLAEIKDIEIWHVNPTSGSSEHASKTFHKVSISEMNSIYKNVDVLVKMSRVEGMFGPPLEAFHSGATAIVSKVTGFDEYIKHRVNSLAVDVDDFEGMKSLIVELDKDRDLLVSLKLGAIATAKDWKSIEESRNEFVSICKIVMRSAIVGSIDREEMESNLQKCILKEFIPFDLLGE